MSEFVTNYIDKYVNKTCICGKIHTTPIEDVIIENGAINKLPEVINRYNAKKAFIIADVNTYEVAGKKACNILEENNIEYKKFIFTDKELEPDEKAVGSVTLAFDKSCDIIIAIGSGVINDTSKILSNIANKPYIIVATAPSMDGYASDTSSMAVNGLKVSVPSASANVIIGDIDIIKNAPVKMLTSGLGDMLAKYISICEWKIATLLIGEYYCETIANLVNDALKKCVDNAEGLLKRDDAAVKAVFEGLIICGIAMGYAKISRPASGMEHYISHVWDMRALAFNAPSSTHGIQCAIGTLYTAKLYEIIKSTTPNREKALKYVKNFNVNDWYEKLDNFMGSGADAMITLDKKEQKYDKEKHNHRLNLIINNWDKIIEIIDALPSSSEIEKILDTIDCPKDMAEIGIDREMLPLTLKAAKDIRDKYVASRLLWDLGIIDEVTEHI